MSIRCGNHNGDPIYHETAADVRYCFQHGPVADFAPTTEGVVYPIGGKAATTAREMKMDRDAFTRHPRQDRAGEPGWMRTDAAPAVRAYPPSNFRPASPTLLQQDGMYRMPDGRIVKAQWNRASGDGRRLYAKVLVLTLPNGRNTVNINLDGEKMEGVEMNFEYAPGVISQLRPEYRMTPEEARKFGALYGRCVRCGRVLTLEESIERMMGAVCAGKL